MFNWIKKKLNERRRNRLVKLYRDIYPILKKNPVILTMREDFNLTDESSKDYIVDVDNRFKIENVEFRHKHPKTIIKNDAGQVIKVIYKENNENTNNESPNDGSYNNK